MQAAGEPTAIEVRILRGCSGICVVDLVEAEEEA